MDIHITIRPLIDYIQSTDNAVLSNESKADLCQWLAFATNAPDSTVLMKWYFPFHTIFSYYISELDERIKLTTLARDRLAAQLRKSSQKERSGKITEGEAKMAYMISPEYSGYEELIIRIERLKDFLSGVKQGFDRELVESYGHNQRLEMRENQDR